MQPDYSTPKPVCPIQPDSAIPAIPPVPEDSLIPPPPADSAIPTVSDLPPVPAEHTPTRKKSKWSIFIIVILLLLTGIGSAGYCYYPDITSYIAQKDLQILWQYHSALNEAAKNGNAVKMRVLLAIDNTNINMRNVNNHTPLSIAAAHGHTECVRILLEEPNIEVNWVRTQDKGNRKVPPHR